MALLATRLVVAAVVSRIDGASYVVAYDAQGPTPPAGMTCIVYASPGDPDGVLGDPDRNVSVEFQTTCVGTTSAQAQMAHDHVVAQLNRVKLTGTGFTTYPVRMVPGSQQPVRRDDALAIPYFYITCSWVAVAQPT